MSKNNQKMGENDKSEGRIGWERGKKMKSESCEGWFFGKVYDFWKKREYFWFLRSKNYVKERGFGLVVEVKERDFWNNDYYCGLKVRHN